LSFYIITYVGFAASLMESTNYLDGLGEPGRIE
jgi:hypothetical protein